MRWQSGDEGVGEFGGGGFAADVLGGVFLFAVDGFQGGFDAASGGAFAEMIEHHDAAHQEGGGIGEALAGDVGRGAVDGFKHGGIVAEISAADNAEAADQTRGEIAHDVAIEIGEKKHVVLLGLQNHLHAGIVDDELFVFDVGIVGGDGANRLEEQAVRKFHDVGFVDGGDFFAAFAFGVFKGELCDARGGALGDDFQAFDDAGNDFVFEAGVKVLGVFADEDNVDILKARLDAGHVFYGAEVCV